jgi:hypothetical protein
MPDQITNEDLYGPSNPSDLQTPGESPKPSEPQASTSSQPLAYEETPEIPMVPAPSSPPIPPAQQDLAPPGKKSGSPLRTVGILVVFVGLFVAGIWLSGSIRDFFSSSRQQSSTSTTVSPTPTTKSGETARPNDPYADWISYEIISGITKKQIPGMSFKLPADVLAPICDGVGCLSQGTYLSGGTRFTIAARGANQTLKDYRGATITDVNGKAFTTKQTTVKGLSAVEFEGTFSGRTVAGYTFSRMRGVMVETSATTSIEINHFTPSGIVADFEKDDALFDQILQTLTVASNAIPIATLTPIAATSSGN